MMNTKLTPKQEKVWLSRLAEYGCVVTGETNIQIHHCVGREGKHNKYHIGRIFVLPLAFRLHDVSKTDEPLNITHHRKACIEAYALECQLFEYMCHELENDGPLPFTEEEMAAIMDTRR